MHIRISQLLRIWVEELFDRWMSYGRQISTCQASCRPEFKTKPIFCSNFRIGGIGEQVIFPAKISAMAAGSSRTMRFKDNFLEHHPLYKFAHSSSLSHLVQCVNERLLASLRLHVSPMKPCSYSVCFNL